MRGRVTSLPCTWLRHAGHEDSVLDGVSPPLRGLASDFSLRGQRKVTKRKATPTCSPSCVGFPWFTRLSDGTRRWALTFAIPGVGQSPLRTSMSLRQTGPSVARPIPVWPWPSGARSASCLAAWTRGHASANKRGDQHRASPQLPSNRRYAPSPLGRGLG